MYKLSCHIEKHRKSALRELARKLAFADAESAQAVYLRPGGSGGLAGGVWARIAQRANPEHAVRRDAVVLCSVSVGLDPGFFAAGDEGLGARFFEEAYRFLTARYGAENAVYAVVQGTQLRFGFVPMTEDLRLCAKEVLDREELCRLQAEFPDFLRGKGLPVARAGSASPAQPSKTKEAPPEAQRAPFAALAADQAQLQRENQRLRLEKLALERQLNGMVGIIQSDPQLELLYMRQVDQSKLIQRQRLEEKLAVEG